MKRRNCGRSCDDAIRRLGADELIEHVGVGGRTGPGAWDAREVLGVYAFEAAHFTALEIQLGDVPANKAIATEKLLVVAHREQRGIATNTGEMLGRFDEHAADPHPLMRRRYGQRAKLGQARRIFIQVHTADNSAVEDRDEKVRRFEGDELFGPGEEGPARDVLVDERADAGGVGWGRGANLDG